jgi:hypothetical protein
MAGDAIQARVFISYSRADQAAAQRIRDALNMRGFEATCLGEIRRRSRPPIVLVRQAAWRLVFGWRDIVIVDEMPRNHAILSASRIRCAAA